MGATSSIVVTVSDELADVVTDRMWQWGVQAVSETSVGGGRVDIATSVGNDPAAIERAVATLDPSWPWSVREVDDSIAQVAPEFLSPTWYAPGMVSIPASLLPFEPDDPETIVTVIDPGSAFGLGDHPTTRTSMALLARLLRTARSGPEGSGPEGSGPEGSGPDERRNPTLDRTGSPDDGQPGVHRVPQATTLLDVGCGTGALAVLAAQLGVPAIRAIDIADAAVEATLRNADLNGVSGQIEVDTTALADITDSYDIVMANILAPVLVALAPDLRRVLRPGGSLVISGILTDRHQHVLDALAPLRRVDALDSDGWSSVVLR